MKRSTIVAALALILLVSGSRAQEPLSKNLEPALRSIQPQDPYLYCRKLASAEFAGRHTGHEGYTRAARWAASKFKEWGLRPLSPKEGYLQAYPSPYTIVDKSEMTLLLAPDFKEMKLEPNRDFLPLLFTDSGRNEAGLVFAGWGISAAEAGYDDYAGLDVAGKYVLCFRGTPDGADKRFEAHDHHRHRMQTAKAKGALGVFYIYPEATANPNGDWIKDFTPAMITEKAADALFKERGFTSAELKKDLAAYKRPLSFVLKSKVRYSVESRHFPKGVGYNVVGIVEGSHPVLKKECIVYGAHFDGQGEHMGFLFAGADDNASGSATVLELAEAFSELPRPPKRSAVFVLFGGEEMGLMGSDYFANHLPPPFGKVDAMFNFDMTGEGDGAWCGASAEPAGLRQALQDADKSSRILRGVGTIRDVGVRSSDFAPFFLKGVPCVSLGSNGPHLAYHQVGDTIYRINPEIMADIARLVFLAGYTWADR